MRIGAVSYLNTKPLVYGLAELAPQHELVFDLPSRLADGLASGVYDVALIPSIEYFQNPVYSIVSDACIACRGPVRSVKLFSRVPLDSIGSLALDEGSRTSVALVRILLQQQFGIAPRLLPFPIDTLPESIDADALLMIGDRAMHRPSGNFQAEWDLGDVWRRWSKLPFVFAMWVGNGKLAEFSELAQSLQNARDLGTANIEQIARQEHAAVGLSLDDCLTYLRDHLHFELGPEERAGMDLFREHSVRLGLAPQVDETKPGPGEPRENPRLQLSGSKFVPG